MSYAFLRMDATSDEERQLYLERRTSEQKWDGHCCQLSALLHSVSFWSLGDETRYVDNQNKYPMHGQYKDYLVEYKPTTVNSHLGSFHHLSSQGILSASACLILSYLANHIPSMHTFIPLWFFIYTYFILTSWSQQSDIASEGCDSNLSRSISCLGAVAIFSSLVPNTVQLTSHLLLTCVKHSCDTWTLDGVGVRWDYRWTLGTLKTHVHT